jgi:hypothetical protein
MVPPEKPRKPPPYNGFITVEKDFTEYGTVNGGWGALTFGDITIDDGKIGKSYGVLGRGNPTPNDKNGGLLLGITSDWKSMKPKSKDECKPKYMILQVAPKTHDQ